MERLDILSKYHDIPENEDNKTCRMVEESQREMLDELTLAGAKHIFDEGAAHNLRADKLNKNSMPLQYKNYIQKAFYNYKPGATLDKYQTMLLRKFGAASIYWCLSPDVELHATTTEELHKAASEHLYKMEKYYEGQEKSPEEFEVLNSEFSQVILGRREEYAIEKMKTFLEKNPGAEIFLVYGKGHNFSQYSGVDTFNPTFFECDCGPTVEDMLNERTVKLPLQVGHQS